MPRLELKFNALCMFVRDSGSQAMHVLMPDTNEVDDASRPLLLAVDRAYLTEGSTGLDGVDHVVELQRGRIELNGEGNKLEMPPEMIPLGDLLRTDPSLLSDDTRIKTRVVLHGGQLTATGGPAWSFGPPSSPSAPTWTVLFPDGPIRLEGTSMNDAGSPPPIPPLYPIDGTIHLRIVNGAVELGEIGTAPAAVDHFTEYYTLVSPESVAIPMFDGLETEDGIEQPDPLPGPNPEPSSET